jgi:hypothetical protein
MLIWISVLLSIIIAGVPVFTIAGLAIIAIASADLLSLTRRHSRAAASGPL